MATTSQRIRQPAVAGRFYPDSPGKCRAEVEQYTQSFDQTSRLGVLPSPPPSPLKGEGVRSSPTYVGGVVPHAGWVCSGRIAGRVWRTLADCSQAKTIFLTGSVHTMDLDRPALDTFDAWATPMGDVKVDRELREAIAELDDFESVDAAHQYEHALEVQLPMVRWCFGEQVRFVPCMIPPVERAIEWGRALGRLLAKWSEPVLVVASSDLTHYGPDYRFAPKGRGEAGRRWAHEVNDRRVLDLIGGLRAEQVIEETSQHLNACGGGAIAAVLAAAKEMGASSATILEHTDSTTVLTPLGYGDSDNSVGYAAVVM